jgi:uncharacterized membrane protein YhfC
MLGALSTVAALGAAGCDGPLPWEQPLEVGEPPWQDGESAAYDVLVRGVEPQGNVTFGARRDGDGWALTSEWDVANDRVEGVVTVDRALTPVRTVLEHGEERFEAHYGPQEVRFTGPDGTARAIDRPGVPLDNDQVYQTLRAVPSAAGRRYHATLVNARVRAALPVSFAVRGVERVTVPAGQFEARRIDFWFLGGGVEAWYATAAPHLLVKRRDMMTGTVYALHASRRAAGAAWSGDPGTLATPPATEPPVRIDVGVLLTSALFQFPVMCLLPLALGLAIWRRVGAGWRWWLTGAGAFIASQVVHLPLNWAIGLLGAPRGVALLPLPAVALIAGLSSGLCEESARYAAMRWVARRDRGWAGALQYGAGHGGIESMIFGTLALLSFINMVAAPFADRLGVPAEARGALADAARGFWAAPWYLPALAGYERLCAIAAHVGMSVLVMRAVTRRNLGYLALAVLAHTALNAPVLYRPLLGEAGLYAILTATALALVGVTAWLRERPPRGSAGGA